MILVSGFQISNMTCNCACRGGSAYVSVKSTIYGMIMSSNYEFWYLRTFLVGMELVLSFRYPYASDDTDHEVLESVHTAAFLTGVGMKSILAWNKRPDIYRRS